MNELSPGRLRQQCTARLSGASYSPKKLALRHTLISVGCYGVLALLNLLLSWLISRNTGLSGLTTISGLETVRSVLSLGVSILMPFWEAGFLFAALHLAQDGNAEPSDLCEGFRRIGAVLRLILLEGLVFFGIGIATMYLSTIVFMMTPLSDSAVELLMPYAEQAITLGTQVPVLEEAELVAITQAMTPMFILWGAVFALIALPVLYRMRLAMLCLLSDDRRGALAAYRESRKIMKGRRLRLLRVDLSFWWYYLLQVLLVAVVCGDVLLKGTGIQIHSLVFYGIYLAGYLLLMWQCRSRVETTYALFYQAASEGEAGMPGNLPEGNL